MRIALPIPLTALLLASNLGACAATTDDAGSEKGSEDYILGHLLQGSDLRVDSVEGDTTYLVGGDGVEVWVTGRYHLPYLIEARFPGGEEVTVLLEAEDAGDHQASIFYTSLDTSWGPIEYRLRILETSFASFEEAASRLEELEARIERAALDAYVAQLQCDDLGGLRVALAVSVLMEINTCIWATALTDDDRVGIVCPERLGIVWAKTVGLCADPARVTPPAVEANAP